MIVFFISSFAIVCYIILFLTLKKITPLLRLWMYNDINYTCILGDHFTKLADSKPTTAEPQVPVPSSGLITPISPQQVADEKRMRQILENPEVHDILQDPRVQKLFEALRNDPESAQR